MQKKNHLILADYKKTKINKILKHFVFMFKADALSRAYFTLTF